MLYGRSPANLPAVLSTQAAVLAPGAAPWAPWMLLSAYEPVRWNFTVLSLGPRSPTPVRRVLVLCPALRTVSGKYRMISDIVEHFNFPSFPFPMHGESSERNVFHLSNARRSLAYPDSQKENGFHV